jgi:glucose-6-phosphate 1-dehydrogenase
MTTRIIPVDIFDLAVFGATGDLAQRKLLPALFHRDLAGQIPPGARIIGVSRRAMTDAEFVAFAKAALEAHIPAEERKGGEVEAFLKRLSYVTLDATQDQGWDALATALKPGEDRIRVFYLATSPDLFGPICDRLGKNKLVTPKSAHHRWKSRSASTAPRRKPSTTSIGAVFSEQQIFRIDHYLGKETVQNLLALCVLPTCPARAVVEQRTTSITSRSRWPRRSASAAAAPITTRSGALRDMVQNHMLQLLCLVAMEPPAIDRCGCGARRETESAANRWSRSTRRICREHSPCAASIGPAPAMAAPSRVISTSSGSPSESTTETFVALKATIANWRWSGVPFYLRTGKRLHERRSEIVVVFRRYAAISCSRIRQRPDRWPIASTIRLQPDEGVKLWSDHQGARPRRYAPAARPARHELRGSLQRPRTGGLRAAADGRDPRQRDAVHAPRRGAGRLELDRPDPRGMGTHRRKLPQALYVAGSWGPAPVRWR